MAATSQRIIYTSKRRTTGLSDVTITIYNNSNTAVVSSATMTELANGIYYYDYTPVSAGYHTWFADSTSQPSPADGTFLSDYTSTSTATAGTATIATTQELARFMHIEGFVPDIKAAGTARLKEVVGTGDGSNTLFYLDQAPLLSNTLTLTTGTSESGASSMTESTHYTIDNDNGTITLNGAGTALVGTANIYGSYSFNLLELTDTQLQDALDRAQEEFYTMTYNRWTDGTLATPNYAQVTNEKHTGRGDYNRDYYLKNYPLPDVSATLSGTALAAGTTLVVDSTSGFKSTGVLQLGTEKIEYTTKDSTTFTGLTRGSDSSSAQIHSGSATIMPFVFELSTTSSGNTPTWTVLKPNTDYDLDYNSGKVHIYRDDIVLEQFTTSSPPRSIPNRFRATYIWGNNTIPQDVKRAVLMIASKDLMHTAVRKANANGFNDFRPENINIDESWIMKTIDRHRNFKFKNT